jgi:hypothetical protein
MKATPCKSYLNLALPVGLFVLSTQLSAVTFDNGGGDNFWGNDANWNTTPTSGAGVSASIATTYTSGDRALLLANSSGVDQSYTVGNLTLGTGSGSTASLTTPYEVGNVSGGTARLIFEASSGNSKLTFKNIYVNTYMAINVGITLNNDLEIKGERNSANYSINGDISGVGHGIDINGAGTIRLNGANSFNLSILECK